MGASTSKFKPKTNKHHTYIAGKPSSPGKPTLKFDPENSDPDIVTIKWDPPLFDGGSKITGYLVEHRRTGSPHWVKASPIKVRHTQLTISGLEPGWRYQFRVTAENAVGYSDPSPLSEPLAVFVHRSAAIAPYFITELDDIIVLENEKVEFNVTFEGVPTPKISWYKDGLEIFSNRCQKISTEGNVSTFFIYEASIADESEIKCSATNRVGYAVTKAYLKVEAPPTIRLPRQYDEGLIFEESEIIRLKASVVGQPQPFINWYFNGERITMSNRYDIEYADKTAILKVRDAQRCDRGEYQIQAINELGEDVASIMVTIANKPQPPGKINVSNIFGRSVTLTWQKPEDDGGCKIGSYIIEYYKTGWNVWLKAATCRQLTTTLDDLIEGSQYKFRVKAENPYGVSEPSPETEEIFIPDPKRGLYEAPKTAHSTDCYISEFHEPFPPINQNAHHSADFIIDRDKLQPPVKPKRKYKGKKLQEQEQKYQDEPLPMQQDDISRSYYINSRAQFTPSPPLSSNLDDTSRTSSELMLVLVPSNEDLPNNTGSLDFKNFSKHFPSTSIAPPMSLSAPELGSEMSFFNPLQRNCVSSTELLHESTIARFYEDMQKEDNLKAFQEKLKIPPLTNKLLNQVQSKAKQELKPEIIQNLSRIEDISDTSDTDIVEPVHYSPIRPDRFSPQTRRDRSPSQTKHDQSPIHARRDQSPSQIQPNQSPSPIQSRASFSNDRQNIKQIPPITLPQISKPSVEFNPGRYSPTSGTFHYPDLFMESLSKSPKFKPTADSMYDVANELIYRKPIKVESHPFDQHRPSLPEIKLTDENNFDYDIADGENPYSSSSSVDEDPHPPSPVLSNTRFAHSRSRDRLSPSSDGRYPSTSSMNDYLHESGNDYEYPEEYWDQEDSETEDSEDNTDNYEDEDDDENETYHPDMVLSFERALEISNPTKYRSVSPTNDMFLESDSSKFGLHYFNKNYIDNEDSDGSYDTKSKTGSEKPPKSILKCHRFSEQEELANIPTIQPSLSKSNSTKKQVRIEEPYRIAPKKSTEEPDRDPSKVIINHYSDIVKQYGYVQKPPTKVYLTYDELKAAAQLTDDSEFADKNTPREDVGGKIEHHDNASEYVPTTSSEAQPNFNTEVEKVKNKVHFVFDFFIDIVMFAFACWLYCFKDERLAVPVIGLMIYRQVYDKIKDKLPSFNLWSKKKS
ncbi:titin [Planococcus citri]|uniref:titin n=1 Tax=Planococcus citri TaxID=170843 RepID=UPI0031F73662